MAVTLAPASPGTGRQVAPSVERRRPSPSVPATTSPPPARARRRSGGGGEAGADGDAPPAPPPGGGGETPGGGPGEVRPVASEAGRRPPRSAGRRGRARPDRLPGSTAVGRPPEPGRR